MLLQLLAALSMGLSNFAGAIAIGVSGVDARTRLKVGTVFGLFKGGMPLVGLRVGHTVAHTVGGASRWLAAGLLLATGAWTLVQAVREGGEVEGPDPEQGWNRLLVTGFALSIDNLAVGFAPGAYQVNGLLAAVLIAAVSWHCHSLALSSAPGSAPGSSPWRAAQRRGAPRGRCRRRHWPAVSPRVGASSGSASYDDHLVASRTNAGEASDLRR